MSEYLFDVRHLHDNPLDRWLKAHARPGWRIGIYTMLIAGNLFDRLAAGCAAAGTEKVALDDDPFDAVWRDHPSRPLGADLLVETLPDNIAGFSMCAAPMCR